MRASRTAHCQLEDGRDQTYVVIYLGEHASVGRVPGTCQGLLPLITLAQAQDVPIGVRERPPNVAEAMQGRRRRGALCAEIE